jgi:hypothetical protein
LAADPCALGGVGACLNNASSPYCPFGFTGVPSLQCPVGVAGANKSWVCCVPFVDLPSFGLPACTIPSLYEGTPNDACASGPSNCETGSSCPGTEVPVISSVCLEEGANGGGSIGSITDCCVAPLATDPCAAGGSGMCGGTPGGETNQEGCGNGYTLVPSATCDQCCLPVSDLPSVGLSSGGSSGAGGSTSGGSTGGATTGGGSSTGGTTSSSSGGSSTGGCADVYDGNVELVELIADAGTSSVTTFSADVLLGGCTPGGGAGPACQPGLNGVTCCYVPPKSGASDGGTGGKHDAGPFIGTSAGTATLDDNGNPLGMITFDPTFQIYDALVSYMPLTGEPLTYDSTLAWSGGDTLTISAPGNGSQVATFSGTLIAPSIPAALSPSLSEAPLVITMANGFTLTWTPGTVPAPNVSEVIGLQFGVNGFGFGTVSCAAPVTAGQIFVDPGLLHELTNDGGGPFTGGITFSTGAAATGTCANASIIFDAETEEAWNTVTYQ